MPMDPATGYMIANTVAPYVLGGKGGGKQVTTGQPADAGSIGGTFQQVQEQMPFGSGQPTGPSQNNPFTGSSLLGGKPPWGNFGGG